MAETQESASVANKRIAKNTLWLYLRMACTMLVGLFTSRYILQALGFEDYGIYNAVAGVISMMGIVTGILSNGTSRFLTFSIGKDSIENQQKTFATLFTIHLGIAALILIVGETIGLWFINNHLVFDASRTSAVNIIYQISIAAAMHGIIQVPFYASIIAKEKMNVFAYFSIWDVATKLLTVLVLFLVSSDKLITFSWLTLASTVVTFSFYVIYCKRKFDFCQPRFLFYKPLFNKILKYIRWQAIGSVAFTCNNQGFTILLNMFFGPAVNAARALAQTIYHTVNYFIASFQSAINPQIIKNYAAGNIDRTIELVFMNAKYSSYLVIFFALPLFIEMDYILHLWLGEVPNYTTEFARLVLIQLLIQAIDYPVGTGIQAVGKMKLPNLTSSIAYLSILPICYLLLKMGFNPTATYIVAILVFPIAFICDIKILNIYIKFPIWQFIKQVPLKTAFLIAIIAIVPCYITLTMEESFLRFLASAGASVAMTVLILYNFGLGKDAKKQVRVAISNKLHSLCVR